jgi:hypothetical protein
MLKEVDMTEKNAAFFGAADIIHRWVYTRQGVHLLMQRADFPDPAFVINGGRTKVWNVADIYNYERAHPEVCDAELKANKVRKGRWIIEQDWYDPQHAGI